MSSAETIRLAQTKSSVNSSIAPLGVSGVFTGATWIDCITLDVAEITVTIKSDVVGVLSIQRSSTGLAVGKSSNYQYTTAGVGFKVAVPPGGGFIRIVYTNGLTGQTTFSLNTYLGTTPVGFSFQSIDEPQLDDTFALNTLANISGKRISDGVHAVVPLMNDNTLGVTSIPYVFAIAEGDVPGHSILQKLGYTNASTAAQTSLWNVGTEYVFPAGAISVEAISTSASDAVAGAGARTVHLTYLDTAYAEKSFTFNMNGATAVPGPTDFFRVNSFHVESGAAAVGVITLRLVGAPATPYSQMPIGATRARNSIYTVPAGKTLYIECIHFSAAYKTAGKSVRMTFQASVTPEGLVVTTGTLFYPYFESMLVDSTAYDPSEAPLLFPATTDIKVSVIGETLAQCTCRYTGWLE